MNIFRLVLTLLFLGSSVIVSAQDHHHNDGGVSGMICHVGRPCIPDPGNGGTAPVDPSPYDPNPHYPYDPNPYNPDPYNPAPNDPGSAYYGSSYQRQAFVGRRVGNEHLDILQMAGINSWSDRGAIIDSVQVYAQVGAVQASVELNADGFVLSTQRWPSNYMVLQPNRALIVGQNFNQLSLGVFGQLYIDRIVVNLRTGGGYNPPPPPPPPYGSVVAQGWLGQSFYTLSTVDLTRVTNLYQFRGYRVVAVTVRGQNLDNRGSARVIVNGQTVGRLDFRYGGETINLPINPTVGYDLSGLVLQVAPTTRIDSIDIQLSR